MRLYTGGTFDCFHAGHVNFLMKCSEFGRVVVSVNSDEFIEEFKGRPPIMTLAERTAVLKSCKYVDSVILNRGGADSSLAILDAQPDIIAIGTDWHGRDYLGQLGITADFLYSNDIALLYIPYTVGISTTDIRKRLDEASNSDPAPAKRISRMVGRTPPDIKDFLSNSTDKP